MMTSCVAAAGYVQTAAGGRRQRATGQQRIARAALVQRQVGEYGHAIVRADDERSAQRAAAWIRAEETVTCPNSS